MTNYTPDEIRDIVREKEAENYYGKIILCFQQGKIGVIEYQTTKKKAEEEHPHSEGVSRGYVE